ncbi:MAG: 30S ribosome-binding factor RbfA [Litorilinea sp.]
MPTIRQQRVSELLFEELSIMVGSELTDPRLLLVQVTSVVVSRDLRNVKVYVSHDNEEVTKEQVLKGLRHATPFLRRQIATRCTLRSVPELLFYYDDTPERAARVESLLRQISTGRVEPPDASVAGQDATAPATAQDATGPGIAAVFADDFIDGDDMEYIDDEERDDNSDEAADVTPPAQNRNEI